MWNAAYFQEKKTSSNICFIAPYCDILTSHGIKITEEYLFGLVSGPIFNYSYLHNFQPVVTPVSKEDGISIVGTKSNIHREIDNLLGIKFYEVQTTSANEAFHLCKNQLEKGNPVIARFDVFFLPYHPQFHKIHAQTNLLLYNWNNPKKQIMFYDGHVTTIPTSVFNGQLSKEVFLQALILGKNRFNEEKTGLIFNNFSHEPLEVDLVQIIKQHARSMLELSDENVGIEGILHLAKEIDWWDSFWGVDSISNLLQQVYLHISGRGGPALSRLAYGNFLKKYTYVNKKFPEVITGFFDVSKKWNVLGVKFFRCSIKYNSKLLKQTSVLLEEIANQEKMLFMQLL